MIHAARPKAEAAPPAGASAPGIGARSAVEAYYHDVAPFYDAELADRPDTAFWQRIASEHQGARVLELGAGSGRVTALLAPECRELIAVDLSPDLLELARVRLDRWPHAWLVRADMRALPIGGAFDLVVAANDPFSHLVSAAERDGVLRSVALRLAPGGRFVLDALWLAPDEARAVASPRGRVRRRTASLEGRAVQVIERWRRAPGGRRRCHARYEYRLAGRPPIVAEFEARDWSPAELFISLGRAGLAVSEVWGDYDRAPWRPTRSSQLIVAAVCA